MNDETNSVVRTLARTSSVILAGRFGIFRQLPPAVRDA